jgi:vesicular inhibitory amino acid transporter
MLGTCAQLLAIGVVVFQLATSPDPKAETHAVVTRSEGVTLDHQLVALMNMIFAFGGQFAFVEIITSMREPLQFTKAISICTALMSTLYLTLGAVGYWSKGSNVAEIVVFSLGEGPLGRVAAACVLLQAIAQYMVNLNVWTHNLLVLLVRRKVRVKRSKSLQAGNAPAGSGDVLEALVAQNGVDSSSNCTVAIEDNLQEEEPSTSSDHPRLKWFLASAFVLAYSYAISMSVPFFSSLVGIVASSTYLICAYALPCWFVLRLFGPELSFFERWLCRGIIPLALLLSAAGLVSSVSTLMQNIKHHGSGFGPEGGR